MATVIPSNNYGSASTVRGKWKADLMVSAALERPHCEPQQDMKGVEDD